MASKRKKTGKKIPDAAADASMLEKADVAVAKAVAPYQHTPVVEAVGKASEIGDQPPLIALSSAVLGWGLWTHDKRLARTGLRMLASHLLATGLKNIVKNYVDRTRPFVLAEEGRYEMHRGTQHEKAMTSFPSGHTAGAIAVAAAVAREYPERSTAAYGVAGAVAFAQIPRCAHYPTDIGAGAVIGWLSEQAVAAAGRAVARA